MDYLKNAILACYKNGTDVIALEDANGGYIEIPLADNRIHLYCLDNDGKILAKDALLIPTDK